MIRRSQKVSSFKGFLCFPGGGVNIGENLVDATIRELKEETGLILPAKELKFCAHSICYHPDINIFRTDTLFRAVLDEKLTPAGSWEGDCKWYRVSDLENEKLISAAVNDYGFVFDTRHEKHMFTYAEYIGNEFRNIKTSIV